MNTRSIRVEIWGQRVGALAPDPSTGVIAFSYYPDWLPLGIDLAPDMMPVANAKGRVWTFPTLDPSYRGLPGLVADSLPDDFGNALIDAWMAGQGIQKQEITVLDRLAYMGRRSMGALEFQPEGGPKEEEQSAPLAMRELVEEARRLVQGSFAAADAASTLQHLISVGTSAGGVRAKAVVAWNPETNEIRSGQFEVPPGFEHWLVKMDGVGQDAELGAGSHMGRMEYAYHLMATHGAGITMAPCRLLEEGGRAHFMTKRFDREGNVKHHTQTLNALAHLSYRFKSTHAYEQFFMAIRGPLGLGDSASMEAFRRMAFNVAIRNHDDHTKNIAFLLPQGGGWQLAPAYDVSQAYNPTGRWTDCHFLSVNGKFAAITSDDLLAVARRFAIPDAAAILKQVDDAIRAWPEFAREAGLPDAVASALGANHIELAPLPLPTGTRRRR